MEVWYQKAVAVFCVKSDSDLNWENSSAAAGKETN